MSTEYQEATTQANEDYEQCMLGARSIWTARSSTIWALWCLLTTGLFVAGMTTSNLIMTVIGAFLIIMHSLCAFIIWYYSRGTLRNCQNILLDIRKVQRYMDWKLAEDEDE